MLLEEYKVFPCCHKDMGERKLGGRCKAMQVIDANSTIFTFWIFLHLQTLFVLLYLFYKLLLNLSVEEYIINSLMNFHKQKTSYLHVEFLKLIRKLISKYRLWN